MSKYERKTWILDEEITEEKLNHMEEGIEQAHDAAEAAAKMQIVPAQEIYFGNRAETGESVGNIYGGEIYVVEWDGVDYVCQCYENFAGGGLVFSGQYVGNAALVTSDAPNTGEPFFMSIGIGKNGAAIWIAPEGEGKSHTVSVNRAFKVTAPLIKATEADEGKILSVVDGKAAWVSVEDSPIATYVNNLLGR